MRELKIKVNPSATETIFGQSRSNDAYAWTGAVAVNRNYTTNSLNQYTAAGPVSFAYDANGNLIPDDSTPSLYDIENRLVSATGTKTAGLISALHLRCRPLSARHLHRLAYRLKIADHLRRLRPIYRRRRHGLRP